MASGRDPKRGRRQEGSRGTGRQETGPQGGGPAIIEGEFAHDLLPDLFRYLCLRREPLLWELTTLAGGFTLSFDQGLPLDAMFRPVRPIGARVGLSALRILMRQEGGSFLVWRGPPTAGRRTLHTGGEKLLIELATRDDERVAPAVLSGMTIDTSSELAAVQDVAPRRHRSALRARSADLPLMEALQLFGGSRHRYRFELEGPGGDPAGTIELSAAEVLSASAQDSTASQGLTGEAAFRTLLTLPPETWITVSPAASTPPAEPPLGKLEGLLLRALLAGGLPGGAADAGTSPPDGAEALGDGPTKLP